jgi:TolB protein
MKNPLFKTPLFLSLLILALGLGAAPRTGAATAEEIEIDREGKGLRLIPVSLSGFTGEVEAVLKFDLEVGGFKWAAPDTAQFLITGSNADQVSGQVQDRLNKAVLLAKRYSGGNVRAQAHAFADDVVLALTGRKGIAQTKIAFRVDGAGASEIAVADYDGFNLKQLTTDRAIVAAPCWVPGRRMLLYTSYMKGNPDIYRHDLGSGSREVVARYSGLNTSATVSPDGRKVAMILSKNGSPDVYVADLDGSNLKQLTFTKEDESSPCWSPNGQTLCFASRARGPALLYTVPAAGGDMRRLATINAPNATEPDWSPDGRSIVFTTLRGGFTICAIPAGGGEAEDLAAGEDPSWAPNSRTVIFTRRVGGRRVLSLLDVPTKQVKTIAQISGSCSQPSWAK